MTKTSSEVVNHALRLLGVVAKDEVSDGDDYNFCKDMLDATLAEIAVTHGFTFTWTVETVPDTHLFALGNLLAARVSPQYMVAPPMPESRAIGLLRTMEYPDDRVDPFDDDEDGVLSEAETAVRDRAAFY